MPPIFRAGLTGGLAALTVLALAACAPDSVLPEPSVEDSGWVLVNPRPLDFHITDLWGTSPRQMFAVGLGGGIALRQGDAWVRVPSPTAAHIWDIHGCDWQHVWAVSDEGLLRFDGLRWRHEGPGDLDDGSRVWCNGPADVMVVTTDSLSHHFDGTSWTSHPLPVRAAIGAGDWLAGAPDGRYMAVGRSGDCARWDGGRWRVLEADPDYYFMAVSYFVDEYEEAWYVAAEYWNEQAVRILVHRDGQLYSGPTFERGLFVDLAAGGRQGKPYLLTSLWGSGVLDLRSPYEPALRIEGYRTGALAVFPGASGYGGDDVLLGSTFGTVFAGTLPAGPLQAITQSVPVAAYDFVVWPNGDFAAREGNKVLHGRSGVLSLQAVHAGWDILDLWGPAPGSLYAAARQGIVVSLRDGLPVIGYRVGGLDGDLLAIWGRSDDDIWVGGGDASAHSDGTAWTVVPWTLPGALADLAGSSDQVFAMSQLALGRWDGSAWTAAGPAEATQYHGLAVAPETGEPVIIARLGDGGARRVMRLRDGRWQDLGGPGDLVSGLLVLSGEDIRVMSGYDWFGWQDGRWARLPLPQVDGDVYAANRITGNTTGGLYLTLSTGGLYHLDLGGLGLWR